MHRMFLSLARRTGLALGAAALLSSTAGAQVQATFYRTFNSPDNPNAPFQGGTPLCSALVGASSGFFLNFTDPNVRSTLCGSQAYRIDPSQYAFAARFTGSLWAEAAGTFDLGLSADDGNVLAVNGIIYDYEWNAIKGGGPGSVLVDLNAGQNDFVLDYNNSWAGGGFVRFTTDDPQVAFVTPEPSSVVLMGSGLLGMFGVSWRRRRRVS